MTQDRRRDDKDDTEPRFELGFDARYKRQHAARASALRRCAGCSERRSLFLRGVLVRYIARASLFSTDSWSSPVVELSAAEVYRGGNARSWRRFNQMFFNWA